ncbi:multicopper oxidase family protein [Marivibrio halodurans]|uniref:Multicopper oxidase family protein n=1 Tax=Marivibrio halodurans TaxID=2039722 RepID=A0A8J7V307_9PROT|nr:multicopper oxidase family protein [Marivibrio halodurans]MBP5857895.1 multicopper oxidase family protein [Marivibrio halodurans]
MRLSRRAVMMGGAAFLGAPALAGFATRRALAADASLDAGRLSHEIVAGKPTADMMSFAADGPPPVLRMTQHQPYTIDVTNRLDEVTTVHWHGLRIANEMDGVPYLTQAPIEGGETCRYRYTAPDAGTFWYHPHCNTLEQMARGMTGVLIVEEAEDPGFDRDIPLNIRDFRLGENGTFLSLYTPRNAARGGTTGTVATVDWRREPVHDLPAGSLVRLRLAVTDTARIATYDIDGGEADGAEARLIALDANPLAGALPSKGFVLAPGQRADVALRVPDREGAVVTLSRRRFGEAAPLARFRAVGASAGRDLAELQPLPPNPVAEPDLDKAEVLDFLFGWTPGGDGPLPSICGTLGYTFWSINRKPWRGDVPDPAAPLAEMRLGRSYILRMKNETPNSHPIHLHGHTFKLLRSNQRKLPPWWTDTVLMQPQEVLEVALVADNPGDWAFHCHVIEHQKTGFSGYLRVNA